mgnify:CR=1 FL=1
MIDKIIEYLKHNKKDWLITILIIVVLLILITIAVKTLSNPLLIYNLFE